MRAMVRSMSGWCVAGFLAAIAACGDGGTADGTTDTTDTDAAPAPDAAGALTCGAIVDPAGGSYAAGCAGAAEGARCELTCVAAGFGSSEPGGATCTAGAWSQPTCVFDLDLDDDGVRRYPWGPDLDDDADGATTIALGGTDLDDANQAVQETAGTGAFVAGDVVTLSANAGTTDLATGDLDNDGDLDLVFTNQNSQEFQIALGNGDGTFATPTSLSLAALVLGSGDGGATVMLGDFDEDGFLDIFGARRRMFTGVGDGSFTPAPNVSWGDINSSVVADVDGDGHLDMLGLAYFDGISTLFGNGDGTWRDDGTPVITPIVAATDLAIGHLDADAALDVVVGTNNNSIFPALGAGDGTFAVGTAITPGYVTAVAVGDIDGDGLGDAVGVNPISDDIYLAIGDGSGGLTSGVTLTPAVDSATSVTLLDLDGDGDRDLVATFQIGGLVRGRNDGAGGFDPIAVTDAGQAFAVVPGDFDRDGKLDLAVAAFNAPGCTIFIGQ